MPSSWIQTPAAFAQSYDLVVNGYEAASGSVRIHDAVTQQKVFSLLGIAPEEAERRFGFLLEASLRGPAARGHRPGARPVGDALLRQREHPRSHRFPENAKSGRPLKRRPSPVDDKQLRDLRIRVDSPMTEGCRLTSDRFRS